MSDNIRETWINLQSEAVAKWMDSINTVLVGGLQDLGIKIDSKTIQNPLPGNEIGIIWYCSYDGYYIEIQAHTANAFFVKIIDNSIAVYWPSALMSTYDRKNYTVSYLLEWLKSWQQTLT